MVKRRLSAILAADVVGYSRLMEGDEAGTLLRLQSLFQDVVRPGTKRHGGRIVKLMGDGLLSEFPSAVDAVTCAIELQSAIAERESARPGESRIALRIGVNLGDIIPAGQDIYGAGVNIAARLEALAEPGGITISGTAHDVVAGKDGIAFDDMGQQRLKNMARPVQVYRVRLDGPPRMAPVATPQAHSIAVLPMTNLSGDPDQDYFSDGITEDVLTELSQIPGLHVSPRNRSFSQRGDPAEAARQLGVRYVVVGSVRRANDRVRINAQLIDSTSGGQIWADRFDRELSDIFALQDEITGNIVRALRRELGLNTPASVRALETAPRVDGNTYDLLLKARYFGQQFTPRGNAKAIALYEDVIAQDASLGLAHAGLAIALNVGATSGWLETEARERALEASATAVALAPTDVVALRAHSLSLLWLGHLDDALERIDAAVRIAPSMPEVIATRGNILCYWGDASRAIDDMETVLRIDPAPAPIWLHFLGHAYYLAGRYEDAERVLRQRIAQQPQTDISRALLVCALGQLGQADQARAEWAALIDMAPNYSVTEKARILPYRNPSDWARITEGFRKAGIDVSQ